MVQGMKKKKYNNVEERVLQTYVKLMRGTDSFTSRTHRHIAGFNLSLSQFQVLEVLYHVGPLCQKEIAQKILKTSGNLTTVVENLTKQGLVFREQDEIDKRFYSIDLTAKGEKLIKKVFEQHLELLVDEMSVLTHIEQEQLALLCKKIGLGTI